MTDADIIKALECCTNICSESCPNFHNGIYVESQCTSVLMCEALSLINRQKAEIERFERESKSKLDKWKLLDDRTKKRYAELYEEAKDVVRAEAIKEFAERLKEELANNLGCPITDTPRIIIDSLVKEMVGERE